MSQKKRSFSAEYKTKVVLEVLQAQQTIAQIASKYELNAKSILDWKKQFLTNASLAFDISSATKSLKEEITLLKDKNDTYAKTVGQLTVERDFLEKKLNSSVSLNDKKLFVETELDTLSVTRQCELLQINRSTLYYKPVHSTHLDTSNIAIMHAIDAIYTNISSTFGYRFMHRQLLEDGYHIGVNKVNRLMNIMNIQAIHPKKRKLTSIKNNEHKIYPYLLTQYHNEKKQVIVQKPNEVWSADITYIRMRGGFMYLAAIIDWSTKAILAYKLSNSMDASLAVDVMKEAIALYGTPKIVNTDQGSQYTSLEHTQLLKQHNIQISMNGKGRSIDNIAIERFFRTLKYDEIYLNDYANVQALKDGINRYMDFYNFRRFHSSLNYQKPMDIYLKGVKKVA